MKLLISYSRGKRSRGNAVIELLVILPALLIILAFATDHSRVIHAAISLDSAVRVGAEAGVVSLKVHGFQRNEDDAYTPYHGILMDGTSKLNTTFTNMKTAAQQDYAIDSEYLAAMAICRCPVPADGYEADDGFVACDSAIIGNCHDPQICLTLAAVKEVAMVLHIPGLPNSQSISRQATICGH